MGGSGTSVVVAVIAPIVTVVAEAVTIASTTFTRGAIFAVAAAVDCFTPRIDLAPVIAVFAVYIALIVNVVAFAASAGGICRLRPQHIQRCRVTRQRQG